MPKMTGRWPGEAMDRWRGEAMDRWTQAASEARGRGRRASRMAGRTLAGEEVHGGWTGGWLLAGLAALAGAAAAYLADPISGARRRAMLTDRTAAFLRDARQSADRWMRMLAGEGAGIQERFSVDRLRQSPPPNDAALADKVESMLLRDQRIPKGRININVEQGTVVLRGETASRSEADRIVREARRIPGVERVDSLLHPTGTPAPPEPPRGDPIRAGEELDAELETAPHPNLPG